MTKKITIHKRNEVARGSDLYSLSGKRCFNAIYYLYQKHRNIFKQYEEKNINYMSIKFSTLRDLMNLDKDNNYVELIKKALVELQTTNVELNNWQHPVTGKKYLWYSATFLNDVMVEKESNISVQLEISTLFKSLMVEQINFTPLDLLGNLNKFSTKYSMKIYEYLKSFGRYRYLDITQKHLMRLLNLKEDDKTYKNYSSLKRLLQRQLKEIAKKTDLVDAGLVENKLIQKDLSKQKIYRITINKKNKRAVEKQEAKDVLHSLFSRIV